eukprot:scaffold29862_cov107-Isochrysis_galbana.AAC.1
MCRAGGLSAGHMRATGWRWCWFEPKRRHAAQCLPPPAPPFPQSKAPSKQREREYLALRGPGKPRAAAHIFCSADAAAPMTCSESDENAA